jgi:hypothetical protein
MGNDKAGSMRRSVLLVLLLIPCVALRASEPSCKSLESAYEASGKAYDQLKKEGASGRKLYTSSNRFIDAATALLAYCREEMSADRQYRLQRVLKKTDNERARYFTMAVREFHKEYKIRPRVQEYYQKGYYGPGPGKESKLPPPSSQPLPPVQQPQLPPISR